MYPIVMYLLYHDRYYTFIIFFPFVDYDSVVGYSLNSFYHVICLLLVLNGSLAADCVFMVAVAHFDVQVNTFFVQLDEFNEFLRLTEHTEHGAEWRLGVKKMVDAIVVAHRDILDKKNRLNDVFFNSIAVQIGTSIISLAMALFLAVTVSSKAFFLREA
jgi:ABC-type sugar transport system permease subunit